MSEDTRAENWNWAIRKNSQDYYSTETAQLAVLMDIRDELQRLNSLLHCPNFVGIPATLRAIKKNTTKPRRKRVAKP